MTAIPQEYADLLHSAILAYIDNMCGEISVLKGVQGLKAGP